MAWVYAGGPASVRAASLRATFAAPIRWKISRACRDRSRAHPGPRKVTAGPVRRRSVDERLGLAMPVTEVAVGEHRLAHHPLGRRAESCNRGGRRHQLDDLDIALG